MTSDPVAAPFRDTNFLPVDLVVERRADGTVLLRARQALAPYEPCLPRVLASQAAKLGTKAYLVQRQGPERAWTPHSYADTKRDADAIAQWLLNAGVARDRPILLLSGNSIVHALVKYGGMSAGVPVCPVSANYGLMHTHFERLRHVVALVRPGVVFVEQAQPFARALEQVDFGDAIVLTSTPADVPPPATGAARRVASLADVLATPVTGAVADRIAALRPDDHCAYMLTSGSTGAPKAVVQTHANVMGNVAQALQTIGDAAGWSGTTMDWLPWSHVSGACGKYVVLASGGTMHIDEGKPVPGPLWNEALRNLREVPSRYYVNVPLGYQLLVEALENDDELRKTFFKDLTVMLYGGAGLPQSVYERLQRLAVATIGRRVFLTTGYGSTETTSGCLSIYFDTDRVGIGLPMPGTFVKLVPVDDERYEVRIAGPILTPGYLRDPERTAESRDEEGYYRMGDLAVFHDRNDPAKGLAFAGRAAEEFKLASGTWISGGQLRTDVLRATAPYLQELVVCGEGHTSIALLAWPNRPAIEREFALAPGAPLDGEPLAKLHALLRERLAAYNVQNPGQSTRVRRVLLLSEPPSPGAHELSDKGTVNRSAVLKRRAADVDRLYAEPAGAGVLVVD